MNTKNITSNTNADFTPALGNYKDLQPFRYWCHKILPMVYDDSLSYYELLCKVVDYLNKTMEDVDTLHNDVTNVYTAYEELQGYVNNYFSTLDVQEEINNKLDQMATSGELYEIIRTYTDPIVDTQNDKINEQNDKIDVLKARMDTFASLPEGSTSGNAELLDIRVGYNGKTYDTAGNAVRGQVSELNDVLDHFQSEVQMYPKFEIGSFGESDIQIDVPNSAGTRARSSVLNISGEAYLEWDNKYGIIIFKQSSEGEITNTRLLTTSNAYYTFDAGYIYRILVRNKDNGVIGNPNGINLCIYNLSGKLWNTIEDNKENIKNISERLNDIESSTMATLNMCNRLYAAETMGVSHSIKPLEKGVVCIGFDDYNDDQLQAINYLANEGLPCYLAVIPSNVNDNWSMARTCYANGGEICAHSSGVLTAQTQTFEDMNTRFVEIPKIIGDNGFPCYGIIRAGGEEQGSENKYLDEYYCRASGLKYSDYYGVSRQYSLGRKNITRFTLSEMQNILDNVERNKTFEILFCHHVNGTEKNSYPNGFTMTDFSAVISEIKSRDIEVLTINEFVDRYIYGIDKTDTFVRN